MTVGVTQALRIGAAPWPAPPPATPRPRSRRMRRRRDPRPGAGARGNVASGKLAQSLAYGARTLLVRGASTTASGWCRRRAKARRVPAQLDQPVPARGAEDDRARAAPAARLGVRRLDRAPGGQPGEHRGVRKGAARGASGLDRPGAPARGGAGGGGGPVARGASRTASGRATGSSRDGGHRDPDRRSRLARPRGARDPETDGVVLAVSDAQILEAKAAVDASGVGCEPASAASVAACGSWCGGDHRARRAGRGGAHGPRAEGSRACCSSIMWRRIRPGRANRPVEIEADLREVERRRRSRTR